MNYHQMHHYWRNGLCSAAIVFSDRADSDQWYIELCIHSEPQPVLECLEAARGGRREFRTVGAALSVLRRVGFREVTVRSDG